MRPPPNSARPSDGTPADGTGEGSWRRIRQVFHQVVERPESERGALLDELCGDDDAVRAEVEELLAAEAAPLPWLERPVLVEAWHRLDSEEAEDQLAGAQLGPYRLEQELGRGGMGTVYLASRADGQYRQRVAVKVIRSGKGAEAARRFRAERQILADLIHPNIARLLDGGVTADGDPFLVMEYIDGEAIDAYCDRHRLSVRQRIELFLQVCAALRHAHRHLVVHCDLKPGNILVTPEGEPKLLDFGIARWLASESADRGDQNAARHSESGGPRWLTLGYASPEQIRGQPPVMASDVYSLGVLLHVLLVGEKPETRPAARRADRQHADIEASDVEVRDVEAPAAPSHSLDRDGGAPDVAARRATTSASLLRAVRGDLDAIVVRALQPNAEQRYGSVDELAADLRRHLDLLPVTARRATRGYRLGRFVRRRWPALGAVLAVVAALAVGLWAATSQAAKAERQRHKAERVTSFVEELFREVDPSRARGPDLTVDEWLADAIGPIRSAPGDQPEVQAELLRILGQGYRSLGRLETAEQLLHEALALRPRAEGRDGARELDALGLLYLDQGKLDAAEGHILRALELRQRSGEDDPELAESLNSLGRLRLAQGEPGDAEALFRQALDLRRRALGPASREASVSLNNLGVALLETGQPAAARRAFEEALDLRRRLFGEDHLLVANSLHNLASLLTDLGDLDTAERYQREALDIYGRRLEADHGNTATGLYNLARLLHAGGRMAEALVAIEEAVAINRRRAQPLDLATARMQEGVLRFAAGHLDTAEAAFSEALDLRRDHLGIAHPAFASTLYSLLEVLGRSGADDQAVELLVAAADAWGSAGGPRSWDLPYVQARLARLRADLDAFETAVASLRAANRHDLAASLEAGWPAAGGEGGGAVTRSQGPE